MAAKPKVSSWFCIKATMLRRRGVAQLIARSVWDREVEGLSPFTPTNKRVQQVWAFLLVRMPQTCTAKRKFWRSEVTRKSLL